MQNPKSHHAKIEDDIIYHLELILIDLERLKLDFNRNPAIVITCENLFHKTLLVCQLYERYDKPVFKALKNKINQLIAANPLLKGILIHVENSRCQDKKGEVKHFKIKV